MADSDIEWTERVWNPVRGCALVSPGCAHCYAMGMGPITLDGRWRAPSSVQLTAVCVAMLEAMDRARAKVKADGDER